MNDIKKYTTDLFENLKHIDEEGNEFWYARELQKSLEYSEWRNFHQLIEKAKLSCKNSGNVETSHFVEVNKSLNTGLGFRELLDFKLTRYACYLIVQNGDPRKDIIALGQTYFAIKTRLQEITEQSEDKKRLSIRKELKFHNKNLADSAHNAGIKTPLEYASFQNFGYRGLYGGLNAKDIKKRKKLNKNQDILDFMGSTELAANLFRATQTDEKLKKENIKNKFEANKIHYNVGKKVRDTIKEIGGTMPEDLPTPQKSIKQIEKEENKRNNLLQKEIDKNKEK